MRKLLFLIGVIGITVFVPGTSGYTDSLPISLVGVYIVEEFGFHRELIQVTYQNETFAIAEYQGGKWGQPAVVVPVSKSEFENLLAEPVDYSFSGLANDDIALFKVPKGWKSGNFVCNTGYWLMSQIGPIELEKK